MREQVQETGVRKWFGDDFINLQTELIGGGLSALFSGFAECVISGGGVTNNGNGTFTIADGIAWLRNNLGQSGKICRFYSQTFPAANFPVYMVQASRDRAFVSDYGRAYKDGATKNVIVEYYGKFETVNPGHAYYLQYTTAGANRRWRDAIQDSGYKFVTDTEKATWNAKAPTMNPVFTGTVQGITAAMVGLGNVANENKATMFTNPSITGIATITDKVGIGTVAPFSRLTLPSGLSSSWEHTDHSSSRRWWIGTDGNAYGDFSIMTESTKGRSTPDITRFYINAAGNVGIGTTTPGQKLEVNGTIKCTDVIII